MSIREVRLWMAYRAKFGPMTDARRFDRPAALIGSILSQAYGGKAKLEDLMPWGKEVKEPSLDDLIAAFGGIEGGKRG